MCYSNNGEQEGFAALILTTLTKKLTFKNGKNRVISPKQRRLPVHVTHGICGMSTYDPLQAIYLVKGEKQRLVGKNRSAGFSRKESFLSFLLNQLGGVQNKHSINQA